MDILVTGISGSDIFDTILQSSQVVTRTSESPFLAATALDGTGIQLPSATVLGDLNGDGIEDIGILGTETSSSLRKVWLHVVAITQFLSPSTTHQALSVAPASRE